MNPRLLGHPRFRSRLSHESLRRRVIGRIVLLDVTVKSKTNMSHLHFLQSLLQFFDSLVQSSQLLFTHNNGVFTMTMKRQKGGLLLPMTERAPIPSMFSCGISSYKALPFTNPK